MTGLRAIVASDDPAFRIRLRDVLGRSDVSVVTEATDGDGVLLACGRERVDVAVLDVGLPGVSGSVLADLLGRMDRPIRTVFVHEGIVSDPDVTAALDATRPEFERELLEALGIEGSGRPIRIFVVDDHEMVRRGIRDLAHEEPSIEFAGEAERAEEALEGIEIARPDVAILDVRLPGTNGVELCREIRSRHPEINCLMFTGHADDEALLNAILAGASGYLLKQTGADELLDAIEAVAAGRSLLDPVASQAVMSLTRTPTQQEGPRLTTQQERVLDLIVEGDTNKEIAEKLGLAEKTVKNYVSALLDRLKLKTRTQAAVYGARMEREVGKRDDP